MSLIYHDISVQSVTFSFASGFQLKTLMPIQLNFDAHYVKA